MSNGSELNPLLIAKPKFTVEELAYLCSPKYAAQIDRKKDDQKTIDNKEKIAALAKAYRLKKAQKLAIAFKTGKFGREDIARDLWKAKSYQNIVTPPPPTPALPPAKNMKESLHRKLTSIKDYLKSLCRMDTLYQLRGWLPIGLRLLLVRIGRITAKVGHTFLPPLFSIFGLSYAITFLIDLAVVLKMTFSPDLIKKELKDGHGFWKPAWIRFKNTITKDNRPYRMMNDAVWFLVNVIVFCTAGPLYLLLNPILNLVGFSFDLVHESFWLGRHGYRHQQLVNKLTIRIEQKEAALLNLKTESEPTQGDVIVLENKIEKLKFIKDEMIKKRNEAIRRHLWISLWTAMVLVGMIMVYFPPTTIPGAFFIGCGLSLLAGSVCTGLGRRIYLSFLEDPIKKLIDKFTNYFFPPKPSNKIKLSDMVMNKKLSEKERNDENEEGGLLNQSASNSSQNSREADGERIKTTTPTPQDQPNLLSSMSMLQKRKAFPQVPFEGDTNRFGLASSNP